MGDVYIEVF